MKKLIAILLALITVFSLSVSVLAADLEDTLGDVIGGIVGVEPEEDEADILTYGIHYDSGLISLETIMYMPSPNITFEVPTEVTVTTDTPIAVDHNWVCWEDQETGKRYYPGDVIMVEGKVTLVAVWEEKTDNFPAFFRSIIAGLQTFMRMLEKFLGAFDAINSTKPIETTAAPAIEGVIE